MEFYNKVRVYHHYYNDNGVLIETFVETAVPGASSSGAVAKSLDTIVPMTTKEANELANSMAKNLAEKRDASLKRQKKGGSPKEQRRVQQQQLKGRTTTSWSNASE